MKRGKLGQVWVETIIYTLIALVMIGAVLAYAKPKIEQMQDKSAIDQTRIMLEDFNLKISDVGQAATGNQRKVDLQLKKGSLKIDGEKDKISFEIDVKYKYSEVNRTIDYNNLKLLTEKNGNLYRVTLTLNYNNYNLTYQGEDKEKVLTKSSQPYSILIYNEGVPVNATKRVLNFELG